MIQRIQSLFLILAALASILLFFFPLAGIYASHATYKFYIYELQNQAPLEPGEQPIFTFMTTLPLLVLNIGVIILTVITIFLYKNRITQMKLVRFAVLLEIVMIALILFIYASIIEKNLFVSPDYLSEAGIYFPLVALVFLILANRSILKDEKLVRSVERLR